MEDPVTNKPVECCDENRNGGAFIFPDVNKNPDMCAPIQIPLDDPKWRGNRTCYTLARSVVAMQIPDCQAGVRDQMNALTAWLDNSNVNGSNDQETKDVRDARSPLLKTNPRLTRIRGRGILPSCQASQVRSGAVSCNAVCATETNRRCVLGGVARANEQPGLTTMHTIWFREHNRIASELESINRNWDAERVFQETRRIMIAEYQHIIYQVTIFTKSDFHFV
jgi:peroxidase